MRISANDIKAGNILDYEGELWMVAKTPEHTKPGKGGAYVQVEMKNLRTGNKLNQRFRERFLNLKRCNFCTWKMLSWY